MDFIFNQPLPDIGKSWTLFLDRDGVINHEKENNYVHTWEQFRFYENVPESLSLLSQIFGRLIVVTNQRGVGKGLTKLEDLHTIHANMEEAVKQAGGRIDAVYYCSDMEDDSPYRKPNPGMGHAACRQFPDIDPARSVMIGNTMSDMEFGRNLGSYTVFLPTTRPDTNPLDHRIDAFLPSLPEFTRFIREKLKV
jgi:histidinol-phosphate phosphatase family protein